MEFELEVTGIRKDSWMKNPYAVTFEGKENDSMTRATLTVYYSDTSALPKVGDKFKLRVDYFEKIRA